MIVIVDYGMGNLRSVGKAFLSQGIDASVTREPHEISRADGLVLPGVGAFGDCMRNLAGYGLVDPIKEHVDSGKPFLGICLGLQVLFEGSDESPDVPGLGILEGRVVRFSPSEEERLKVPHMGWNRVFIRKESPVLAGIPDGNWFYFVHSYYPVPKDAGVVAVTSNYGVEFTAAVAGENLFACQFHPEKSSADGLRILRNFAALTGGKIKAASA
ncbi:MAG TPA: imidazole glycerol phosphate synthase subunit HisH [Thermodesulfobacteriota bacterium]|nr:imidazole glycerol phosphate synthase subunit HisH [Thermodesulfobacteriota bacterium]